MPEVRYVGNTRRGTVTPRKMWWPGETLEVDKAIADELVKESGFVLVKSPKKEKPKK